MFLQFPLYWFSMPGIMKGWVDRVLAQGFAFTLEKIYSNGVFKVIVYKMSKTSSSSRKQLQH